MSIKRFEDLYNTAMPLVELTAQKDEAYGNSFDRSGEFMKILYPDGVQPDQYDDMLAIIRVIDKLFRIARDKDALGECPWNDIFGYSLLAGTRDRLKKLAEAKNE